MAFRYWLAKWIINFIWTLMEYQEIQKKKLSHCNFQLWFPREKSEKIMLRSPDRHHGACWSSVPTHQNMPEFLKEIQTMLS
jgi:hypothetical protein